MRSPELNSNPDLNEITRLYRRSHKLPNYNASHYSFSGVPAVGGTLEIGLRESPSVFSFVSSEITTPEQINVNGLTTGAEVAELVAAAINGSDLNQGWSAEQNGSTVNLTPPSGNPGSMCTRENATNSSAAYDGFNPQGVIRSG